MDTFSIITNALRATENDPDKADLNASVIEVGRILHAVQAVVDALTPPDGGRYVVGFADISTAATSLGERRIIVSSKPLYDASLTLAEKAVVVATFAAHEIGHTVVTRPRKDLVVEHNRHSGYHAVANLADDIVLEPVMTDLYPILEDAFEFTGMWVLRATSPVLPKTMKMKRSMTTAERFNVVLNATRYGDIADIVWSDGVTRSERDWARDWAQRLIALRLTNQSGYIALCDEVWERIRSEAEEEPEPEQPDGDEPTPGEGEDEGEDDEQDGEDGESEPGGESDEPVDEQGEDEGEGGSGESEDDEAEDDESEGGESEGEGEGEDDESEGEGEGEDDESEGTDEGGESLDGAEESESEGGSGGSKDPQDEPVDWDDDDRDDEGETSQDGHIDGSSSEEGRGGGGNAEANTNLRDEDSFDQNEVEKSTHEQSQRDRYDSASRMAEQNVRTYASTTVTAFGVHGSLTTEWS